MIRLGRRRFLQLGLAFLALPLLESDGNAQDSAPVYFFFAARPTESLRGPQWRRRPLLASRDRHHHPTNTGASDRQGDQRAVDVCGP